jgi:hypothetical protein
MTDELHALSLRYARGCDRRDFEGVASLFAEDGRLVLVDRDIVLEGRAAIAERLEVLKRWRVTTHFVGNYLSEVDGDEGTGETYCLAHHLYDDRIYVMSIRYLDRYTRTVEGWRFAERALHVDWSEDRPFSPPDDRRR